MNPSQGKSKITIRPMQVEDIGRVHQIDVASFSLPWPERSFRYELVENPGSLLWVSECEHPDSRREVVGLIVVWIIIDEAHIATVAVDPKWRGQGIGRKMLAVALHESYRRGMVSAMLEVRAGNEAAQQMYRDFGFEVVGHRHGYYQDNGEDALLMTLKGMDASYDQQLVPELERCLELKELSEDG